jgi:hypothetical protein
MVYRGSLQIMISCASYEEAARRSGVSVKQIYTWLKNPVFQKEVKKHQNLVFSNALCLLRTATQKAVQALITCLDDGDSRVRLSSADKIFANAFKGQVIEHM